MKNIQNHELVPITKMQINRESVQGVNLRMLHARLESKQEFARWIKARIETYGFVDNQDFISFGNITKREIGATVRTEYYATLDMAKELAMIERNEIGRKFRRYFIACEKRLQAMHRTAAIESRRAATADALSLSKNMHDAGIDIYALAKLCYFRQMGLTQREAGNAMGISREKIQTIERQLKNIGVEFAYIPGNKRAKMAFASFDKLFTEIDIAAGASS